MSICYNWNTHNVSSTKSQNCEQLTISGTNVAVEIINKLLYGLDYGDKREYFKRIGNFINQNQSTTTKIDVIVNDNVIMLKCSKPERKFVNIKMTKLLSFISNNKQTYIDEKVIMLTSHFSILLEDTIICKDFEPSDYHNPIVSSCMTNKKVPDTALEFYQKIGAKFITDKKTFRCLAMPTKNGKYFIPRIYSSLSSTSSIKAMLNAKFGFIDNGRYIDISKLEHMHPDYNRIYIDGGSGYHGIDMRYMSYDANENKIFLDITGSNQEIQWSDLVKFRTVNEIFANDLLRSSISKIQRRQVEVERQIADREASILEYRTEYNQSAAILAEIGSV